MLAGARATRESCLNAASKRVCLRHVCNIRLKGKDLFAIHKLQWYFCGRPRREEMRAWVQLRTSASGDVFNILETESLSFYWLLRMGYRRDSCGLSGCCSCHSTVLLLSIIPNAFRSDLPNNSSTRISCSRHLGSTDRAKDATEMRMRTAQAGSSMRRPLHHAARQGSLVAYSSGRLPSASLWRRQFPHQQTALLLTLVAGALSLLRWTEHRTPHYSTKLNHGTVV